jgi:hypothetical protein
MTKTLDSSTRALLALGALAAATAVAGAHPSPARACGGFFCSQSAPVEQTAEEIIFSHNGDGTVTAVISIRYQGPSEKFAWVLPVAGNPTVSVSSDAVFSRLRDFSEPRYGYDTTFEGECKPDPVQPGGPGVSMPGSQDAGSSVDDDGIGLVARGEVGPYEYEVISVDPALEDPAQSAVDWLNANGYDVTGIGPDVLRPYLADELNLIAFKLLKATNVTSGSIRPVVLTYEGDTSSIPIRPTAVAAANDMGVRVWILGTAQAVPVNYKSLVLNEALIDWFSEGANYERVVTAAANEAGGQGFVTEMAAPSSQLAQVVFSTGEEQQWLQYSLQSFSDGFDMILSAPFEYRGWNGWREAVCGALTLPSGVTCDEVNGNISGFRQTVAVDEVKFMRALYEGVVRPVMRGQDLLNARPYFTRMFSTMSADEMTLDPAFDLNPDLADVSNVHTAQLFVECNKSITYSDAPWRLELPQGGMLRGVGYDRGPWPLQPGADVPANFLIVQLGTSGTGEVLENNGKQIRAALDAQSDAGRPTNSPVTPPQSPDAMVIGGSQNPASNPVAPRVDGGTGADALDGGASDAGTARRADDSDDCSVTSPGATRARSLPLLLLASLLMVAARRRRSR